MATTDGFSARYGDLLTGSYDCVDRIVLNAYNPVCHSPGGFRVWWRRLYGDDAQLDNTHLMRLAGEPARQPHQMRVVQLCVVPVQAPPPDAEPARAVAHRVVGIQHDPVHAVVGTGQKIPIPRTEPIGGGHETRVSSPPGFANCPEGATDVGRSPKIRIEILDGVSRPRSLF